MNIMTNVLAIIKTHAKVVSDKVELEHLDSVESKILERGVSSPIEQVMYSALITERVLRDIGEAEPIEINGEWHIHGLSITPQMQIGVYRVDFLVEFSRYYGDGTKIFRRVIIECDSQEFHDRTQQDRAYEKKRDRFLQKKDYKVFRYTGSEILKSSLSVSSEILDYLTEK
jgi:very-short-patch-repair endonuclease